LYALVLVILIRRHYYGLLLLVATFDAIDNDATGDEGCILVRFGGSLSMARGAGTKRTEGIETTIPARPDRACTGANIPCLAKIRIAGIALDCVDRNVSGQDIFFRGIPSGLWWPLATQRIVGGSPAGGLLFFDWNGNHGLGVGDGRHTDCSILRRVSGAGGPHGIVDRIHDSISQVVHGFDRPERWDTNLVVVGLPGVFWNGTGSGLVDVGVE